MAKEVPAISVATVELLSVRRHLYGAQKWYPFK
jgi:hypothetical protein